MTVFNSQNTRPKKLPVHPFSSRDDVLKVILETMRKRRRNRWKIL